MQEKERLWLVGYFFESSVEKKCKKLHLIMTQSMNTERLSHCQGHPFSIQAEYNKCGRASAAPLWLYCLQWESIWSKSVLQF